MAHYLLVALVRGLVPELVGLGCLVRLLEGERLGSMDFDYWCFEDSSKINTLALLNTYLGALSCLSSCNLISTDIVSESTVIMMGGSDLWVSSQNLN